MPLVAAPVIPLWVWLVGGGATVATGHVVLPGRRERERAIGDGVSALGEALSMERARDDADATPVPVADATTCTGNCPCKRTVVISETMSPEAANHISDAQKAGHPKVLTLNRAGTAARRAASLRGIPTRPGMDRDEYPPATFLEGGAGASVRHIPLSDNRSAGAQIRNQLRGATEGCIITMTVGP